MSRSLMYRGAAAGLALALSAAAALAEDAPAAPAKPAAPAGVKALPIGGYVKAPAGSQQLRELKWRPADGYPLYTLDRECNGQCAVLFPPLTPASADAKPPSRDWKIRVREENGALQWVYKGKPVYTYIEDKPDEPPKADNIVPGVRLARK